VYVKIVEMLQLETERLDRVAKRIIMLIQNVKFDCILLYIICSGWYLIAMEYVPTGRIEIPQ
jgi:hypothetical protein